MLSDRIQRQVDRLLDQAEQAIALRQWEELRATCEVVLNLDPDNSDAAGYLALADKSLATEVVSGSLDIVESSADPAPAANTSPPTPVVPQDAEPEDRPDTNPIDSRTSGQRVRDLAVANSKLAREQSESGRPPNPTASSRETRRRVQERIRLGQKTLTRKRDDRFRTRGGQAPQTSSPRSRNLDSHNARSYAYHDDRDWPDQLIGTDGRINRMGYLIRALANTVAAYVAVLFMGAGLSVTLIGVVLYIAVLVVGFCSVVRRFHDFNWGGASVLLLLIPLVNIVIVFMLLFRSGTRGTNDHGHEPVDLAVGF